MLSIALINVNTCANPYPVFPLGLAHLAATLNAAGYHAQILDVAVEGGDLENKLRLCAPDAVGLSLRNIDDLQFENTALFTPALSAIMRRVRTVTQAPVILGGSGYSLFPGRLLEITGADFGITGEAECSLPLLLDSIRSGSSPAMIPGLVYRRDGAIIVNPKTPCPNESILTPEVPGDIARYYLRESSMLNVQTQRGCGYTCCYCTYPLLEGARFRRRSAASVIEDFRVMKRAGAPYVFIVDSVFNTSNDHVAGVCEELIRADCGIKWGCFLRPAGLTADLAALMAKAGCTHVEFGTDSLCDAVLEAYGKGFSVGDVIQASDRLRAAGIYYSHFLILGGPSETEATIRESFSNSRHIPRTVYFPFIGMRLYPATPLYDYALREGGITADTDLLLPYFYFSPHINAARIRTMLLEHAGGAPNWIVGDISVQNSASIAKLRHMGLHGPLWEYLIR